MWTTKRFGLMTAALVLFGVFFKGSNSTTEEEFARVTAEELAFFKEDEAPIRELMEENPDLDPESVADAYYNSKALDHVRDKEEKDNENWASMVATGNETVKRLRLDADAALKAVAKAKAETKAATEAEAEAAAKAKAAAEAEAEAATKAKAAAEAEAAAKAKTKAANEAEAEAKAKAKAKREAAVKAEANAKAEAMVDLVEKAEERAQDKKAFECAKKADGDFDEFRDCVSLPSQYDLCETDFAPDVAYWNCD